MAVTAENCAAKYNISREDQDRYALRSQQLAAAAWKAGRFTEEIVAVEVKGRKGTRGLRPGRSPAPRHDDRGSGEAAAGVHKNGCVTAGNASGIVDGAAAILLASEKGVKEYGLEPLGRLTHWATVGVEPTLMGMGPAPATRMVLDKAGLTLDDIDLIEVNEAFAAQYLAVEQELGLDRDKVNVNGGAIALGHPLGMTGTRLLLTLVLELRRRGQRAASPPPASAAGRELRSSSRRITVQGSGCSVHTFSAWLDGSGLGLREAAREP